MLFGVGTKNLGPFAAVPIFPPCAADLDWVEDVELRLREEGQVYFGEALVVPSDETNITEKIEAALKQDRDLDWRIYDLALVPVRELPQRRGQAAEEKKSG